MHTERFNKLRKQTLSKIFSRSLITKVWRNIVRGQLRSMDIKDLFDHYDFNYNIEEHAQFIRNEISNGNYKVSRPFIYKLEKKFGVCRHIVIPQPIDALVLQVLVEAIADEILKNQPSKNVFYSRDKHRMHKPHEAWDDYGLSLKEQWKELQKKIYKFNQDKELLIVTDLSNYYDSISTNELQKVILGYIGNNEVLIDLLFRVVEEISWRPDYLPYSNKGLPTSNLEAIRLLAHSFLFEIDEVIKQKSNNNFTRWMDDIVIGADDKKNALEMISSVSDMLKSRGLALNLSKTNIYTSSEAHFHFQIDENKYLDSLEAVDKADTNIKQITTDLKKGFKKHLKVVGPKYWDKIAKRYITAFGRLESLKLLPEVTKLYIDYPGLRTNLLIYLTRLGHGKKTGEITEKILNQIDVFDDISLFQICNLLTIWEISITDTSKDFIKNIGKRVLSKSFLTKKPTDFYSALWFKSKYDHPEDLLIFIKKYENLWRSDSFLRRQVTAILSRLLIFDTKNVALMLEAQISSGIPNTVTLANQILFFSKKDSLDTKLSSYLFPKKEQRPYPLPKFLVLCSVLNSEDIRSSKRIKSLVLGHLKDPWYRKWLDQQYNIS